MSGRVDCHAHVFSGGFPLSEKRAYTPRPDQAGTPAQYAAVLASHGFTHALLVGAQPYDTDNSCLLAAIAASHGRFKGIALVDAGTTDREFRNLADGGIVGIRINLSWDGHRILTEPGAERVFSIVRENGWFVQVHCEGGEFAKALPLLRGVKARLMIDHFGRPEIPLGKSQPGFRSILEYGRDSDAVCKLSGPFRTSRQGAPYSDVDPFIAGILDAFTPDRCVWGSDWPFVCFEERVDYGPQAQCIGRWLPDRSDREKVLWETPSRLFGFAA